MKKQIKKALSAASLALVLTQMGFAQDAITASESKGGHGVGNGGGSIICKDNDGKETLQMYDLYEGETRYKFPKQFLRGLTKADFIQAALDRVKKVAPSLSAKIEAAIKLTEKKIQFTNDDLDNSSDAKRTRIRKGCKYVQTAIWDERTNRIDVNQDAYNKLEHLDQAALIFHEAYYFISRKYFSKNNSDDTREFVARVFMNQEFNFFQFIGEIGAAGINDTSPDHIDELLVRWSDPNCYDFEYTGRKPLILSFKVTDLKSSKKKHLASAVFGGEKVPLGKSYTSEPGYRVANLYVESVTKRNRHTDDTITISFEIIASKGICIETFKHKSIRTVNDMDPFTKRPVSIRLSDDN